MLEVKRLIYPHDSESDSNSGKARQFRGWFPGVLTPDFKGSFDEWMSQLYSILSDKTDWTLIGSSFGGLMGATYTHDQPTQVRKLILLAPALTLGPFASRSDPSTGSGRRLEPVSVRTIVVHGMLDTVVPLDLSARWYKNCLPTLNIMWWKMTTVCINRFKSWIGIRSWNKTTQLASGG
jgi:pimeloyl-ACP methyl ester carboxylesterase